jgi:hypothetical protein
VHLVGFIIRKFVTMHGHMNVTTHGHMNVKKKTYSVFVLLVSRARQPSRYVPAGAVFLSGKAAVLGDMISVTCCIYCGFKFLAEEFVRRDLWYARSNLR